LALSCNDLTPSYKKKVHDLLFWQDLDFFVPVLSNIHHATSPDVSKPQAWHYAIFDFDTQNGGNCFVLNDAH
jgi:hypothetical protein